MKSGSTAGETKRLELVHLLRILDSEREQQFDDIASLASLIFDVPIALIAIADQKRFWFKSRIGVAISEVERKTWFGEETILAREILEVPDVTKDSRFQRVPWASSGPKVHFYAGVPLLLDGSEAVGTLSICDIKPRRLTGQQRDILKALGRQATALLQSRRNLLATADELSMNKELAASATKVKTSILANISHEIRTPMTAILGMADLLLSAEPEKDQREYLHTIRSNGESLLNTINDILDFSRLESGKMELENRPVDLRACIEEILDTVSPKAHAKGNEIVYVIDANVPLRVMGDSARIRQILTKLLDNAIKFTHRGDIFLSVKTKQQTQEYVELLFSVKDTGIGVPADKRKSIFEAFAQADSSVTRRYGGVGLGLAICARLVGFMGGRLEVESTEGKGSEFSFTMRTTALPDQSPVLKPERLAELKGKRVLIVDDSTLNLQILSAECKQWGMIPMLASSPAEALQWLRENESIDVAIYDMQMPEKDGVELAEETRELRKADPLPIILLSSWDLSDPRIKDNHSLFAATVMKPLKISQFQSLLQGVVGAQPSPQIVDPTGSGNGGKLASEIPASILVAEDNLINQKLMQRMLRPMGYEPLIVGTGLEALNALEQKAYDIIFMDVQMPEMDGLEATRKIRQRYGETGGPRIVAMTAFALTGYREKCLNAGMNDYLSKPFTAVQVASMIRKWGGREGLSVRVNTHRADKETAHVDADIQARLHELERETDTGFLKELVAIFLDEAPVNFQNLIEAHSKHDAKAVEHLAHKLKGSCVNLGVGKLSGLLERLEEYARNNVDTYSEPMVADIDQEFTRIIALLHSYVAGL